MTCRLNVNDMRREETTFSYAPYDYALRQGELTSSGPHGSLRARLAGPDERTTQLGVPEMYTNAARILGDRSSVELSPGVWARRDALGGVSISTGNLRERMQFEAGETPSPAVTPAVSPAVSLASRLSDAVDALTHRRSSPAVSPVVSPARAPVVTPPVPTIDNPFVTQPLKELT